jgi:hypothetical protein
MNRCADGRGSECNRDGTSASTTKTLPPTAESMPSVSGGMHAAQKLLSDKGEATTHHLNVSLLLGQWMKDNGHVLLAMFLAWKGTFSVLFSSFLPQTH